MKKQLVIIFIVLLLLVVGLSGCEELIQTENQESETGFEWFQIGNSQPITQLQVKESKELGNNRMGDMLTLHPEIQIESPDDLANRINEKGLKWMRLSIDTFDWIEVEDAGLYSEHYIYPKQDDAITALVDNGIKVMYVLVFWDEEIQVEGEDYSRFKTEDEIQRYLDYVQFIVQHFEGHIEYYEILNEPNAREGTPQYVEVADYINLVKRTIPVIREEDPEAKIVVGAVTPLYLPSDREYFFAILESDVMPLVDAVSFHALGPKSSPEFGAEDYYNYSSLLQDIKDTASSHGFDGEYIAAELHWRTLESYHPHEPWVHTDIAAAKYDARGIITQLGMNFTTGLAECLECQPKMTVIQCLSTLMAGAEPTELPIEIQSEATNIENYSFSLPNGDTLVAFWTDGVAVDEDPGVEANLIVQGVTSEDVIGIDVLNGYQQSITTSKENGNLVIRNLIVRDYPLILHIVKSI
jgi:hypothetical protein